MNKHHQTYVNNANKLVVGTPWENTPLETAIMDTAPMKQYAVLFNNVAQIWNHSFFWDCMTPKKTAPSPKMLEALDLHFGGLEKFQEKFSQNALALFGSGWVWLCDNDGQLEIVPTFNAGTPITMGREVTPLLTIDVWEHAYYVDYENRRADHIKNFWGVVDWEKVEQRLFSIKRSPLD